MVIWFCQFHSRSLYITRAIRWKVLQAYKRLNHHRLFAHIISYYMCIFTSYLTWLLTCAFLACLPASQPRLPKFTFSIDWMCQVPTCANPHVFSSLLYKYAAQCVHIRANIRHTKITANTYIFNLSIHTHTYLYIKRTHETRRWTKLWWKENYVHEWDGYTGGIHGWVNCQYALLLLVLLLLRTNKQNSSTVWTPLVSVCVSIVHVLVLTTHTSCHLVRLFVHLFVRTAYMETDRIDLPSVLLSLLLLLFICLCAVIRRIYLELCLAREMSKHSTTVQFTSSYQSVRTHIFIVLLLLFS